MHNHIEIFSIVSAAANISEHFKNVEVSISFHNGPIYSVPSIVGGEKPLATSDRNV